MNQNIIVLITGIALLCLCAYRYYALHKARKDFRRKMSDIPSAPWERSTLLPGDRQNSVRHISTPTRSSSPSRIEDDWIIPSSTAASSSSYSSDCSSSSDSGGSCGCD